MPRVARGSGTRPSLARRVGLTPAEEATLALPHHWPGGVRRDQPYELHFIGPYLVRFGDEGVVEPCRAWRSSAISFSMAWRSWAESAPGRARISPHAASASSIFPFSPSVMARLIRAAMSSGSSRSDVRKASSAAGYSAKARTLRLHVQRSCQHERGAPKKETEPKRAREGPLTGSHVRTPHRTAFSLKAPVQSVLGYFR
jgi:hypothetical protein